MKSKINSAFTLIEMLVVMSIISIIASMSFMFIAGMKNDAIKQAGQIVKAVFMRTSQLASGERKMYFILFDKEKFTMAIYEDTDDSKTFDDSKDKAVGEAISLPKGVVFSEKPPLFQRDEVVIGFNSNGSLAVAEDIAFDPPVESDIILEQANRTGKYYIDYSIATGRIGKMVYWESDN
jgi:prepilin-type N-terminal cleavage/methylation domain-containing protein